MTEQVGRVDGAGGPVDRDDIADRADLADGETEPNLADRYLDLMKRCLTRIDFDEGTQPVVPGSAWVRQLWAPVTNLLARRDILVHRRVRFERAVREEGRDWPNHAETMIGLRRLDNLQECVSTVLADDVLGDLLEAGVWRGGAGIFMRAALAAHGDTVRKIWMADSFQGLPKPRPEHPADAADQHWTQPFLAVSVGQVKDNFARYGLLDDRVRFLEGWFADTLPTAPIDRLAVLRVDGDMYGSTMDVLDALYAKVSVGGFVVIDDYGAIAQCRSAVEDFREQHGINEPLREIDWTGVYWRVTR